MQKSEASFRIVVPIKQVPETGNVKMDPETGTMVRSGVGSIINPLDLYAIEAALQLRQQMGGHVTALSMGPASAQKALEEAIAIGCDDAILLSNKGFAGSDTWATSYTLTQAVKKMGKVDLILCGERATDGDTGQVGPGMASFLDMPVATYVSRIYDVTPDSLHVERLVEGGKERLKISLPAVLTVVKEIAIPRMPTLRSKLEAKASQVPVWGPEEVEADTESIGLKGSPTRVVKIDRPQVARKGTVIHINKPADVNVAATRLVDFLRERNFV